MLDPQMFDSGDCECPVCGDDATWHSHPHMKTEINCPTCGTIEPDDDL